MSLQAIMFMSVTWLAVCSLSVWCVVRLLAKQSPSPTQETKEERLPK